MNNPMRDPQHPIPSNNRHHETGIEGMTTEEMLRIPAYGGNLNQDPNLRTWEQKSDNITLSHHPHQPPPLQHHPMPMHHDVQHHRHQHQHQQQIHHDGIHEVSNPQSNASWKNRVPGGGRPHVDGHPSMGVLIEIPMEHRHKKGTVTCRHWKRGRCDLKEMCNFAHHDGAVPHTPVRNMRGGRSNNPSYPSPNVNPVGYHMDMTQGVGMHAGSHSRMMYAPPSFQQQSDFRSRESEQGRCSVPPMCPRPIVPQSASGGSDNPSKYVLMPTAIPQGHEQHPMDNADWEPGRNSAINPPQQQAPAYSPMVYPMPMENVEMDDEGFHPSSNFYNMQPHNRMSPEVEPCHDPMSWLNAPNSARVHFSDHEEGHEIRSSRTDVDGQAQQQQQQQQPAGSNERIQ